MSASHPFRVCNFPFRTLYCEYIAFLSQTLLMFSPPSPAVVRSQLFTQLHAAHGTAAV